MKLEIRSKAEKLNNTLLNNQWVKEKKKKRNKRYLEINKNGNTAYQNLWNKAKVTTGGKFYSIICL